MRRLTLFTVIILLFSAPAFAGSLDDTAAPTDSASRMYTLLQIYNRLHSGTTATKPATAFVEPAAGPVAGTMKTLDQILDDFNTDAALCGATAADVVSGKKFFATTGATRGTNWGPVTGTYTPAGSSYGIPKTGANPTTYAGYTPVAGEDLGTIGTPASGDRFTDTAGTTNSVTDNGTGLIWVKNEATIGIVAGYNFASTMSWSDALLAVAALNAANSGAGYDGSNQWRLPNIRELPSIIDYGKFNPAINTSFFTSQVTNYWSSTTYFGSAPAFDMAFRVAFYGGTIGATTKNTSCFVRPVRGG